MRKILNFIRCMWGDHGEWPTRGSATMTATRGPLMAAPAAAPYVPGTKDRTLIYKARAEAVCREFGHTLYRSWCVVCETLVGVVTVEAVTPPEETETVDV